MADENEEEKPDQASGEGDGSSAEESDDAILDLDEDLAKALASSDTSGSEQAEVNLDAAIDEMDPDFKDELKAIDKESFQGVVIEQDRASDAVDENAAHDSVFKTFLKNMPKEHKRRYIGALAAIIVLLPIAFLIYSGKLLPQFQLPYQVTMLELTKDYYPYNPEDVQVPLFDEFRTRSFTMTLPKSMINLQSRKGETVYGEFEFFLNLRERDLEKVIKAHESEIMDITQRVLERVFWEDLQSPLGKEKVKKALRYRLNEYLEGNMILGVYYQSVLLRR